MSDIGERVKKIVVEHLGVEPEKVVDNASFIDDLGADSLDTVLRGIRLRDSGRRRGNDSHRWRRHEVSREEREELRLFNFAGTTLKPDGPLRSGQPVSCYWP